MEIILLAKWIQEVFSIAINPWVTGGVWKHFVWKMLAFLTAKPFPWKDCVFPYTPQMNLNKFADKCVDIFVKRFIDESKDCQPKRMGG